MKIIKIRKIRGSSRKCIFNKYNKISEQRIDISSGYLFKNNLWIALDATHYGGGRATIDDVEQDGVLQNSRLGATLAIPVNKNHSVKLYASAGVSTRTGTNFDTIGAAWQYRWGGGL